MNFDKATVLCIGDIMLDRYVYGDISRISPEAPIPVMRLSGTREMLGGVGNGAHNVSSLGGNAIIVSLIAADSAGEAIRRMIDATARLDASLVMTTVRPTICKTRLIAARQQVVRADEESELRLQAQEEEALLPRIAENIERADAVLLSDYGKAVLSPKVIAHAIELARQHSVPVFIDPKTDDFSRYRHATCITPNLKELALASKMPVSTDEEVIAAACRVMEQAQSEAILVTRSERGMMLVQKDGSHQSLPARAREVFDVSGAGDTVIATMALAHASGMSLKEAMRVANAAAGVVVSKLGTATATLSEVMHELDDQESGEDDAIPGLVNLDRAEVMLSTWRERGLTIGFTNGCFDLVHPGHVSLLKAARAQCSRLIVALNSDASVRRLKGSTRPVNDLRRRAQVMAAMRYVDCVVSFDADTPLELIKRLKPDVLIKGGDYQLDEVVGASEMQSWGGRVYLAQLVAGQSTTNTLQRAREPLIPMKDVINARASA
jgi:D-beta-D-heptose 7-phosphate kinase / D-beta-D-heptose 1-phosphate adenosyltransferase